jgi:hypothetical protein
MKDKIMDKYQNESIKCRHYRLVLPNKMKLKGLDLKQTKGQVL